jgi:diguanylate cyclase (GGDEF)-like protein
MNTKKTKNKWNRWKKIAYTDYLTSVYNIRYLFSRDIQRRQYQYLYFVDINNLKAINSQLGFIQGNEHIKDVARILKNTTKNNGLVFRIGGDEFVVLSNKQLCFNDNSITIAELKIENNLKKLLEKASLLCFGKKGI